MSGNLEGCDVDAKERVSEKEGLNSDVSNSVNGLWEEEPKKKKNDKCPLHLLTKRRPC